MLPYTITELSHGHSTFYFPVEHSIMNCDTKKDMRDCVEDSREAVNNACVLSLSCHLCQCLQPCLHNCNRQTLIQSTSSLWLQVYNTWASRCLTSKTNCKITTDRYLHETNPLKANHLIFFLSFGTCWELL